MSDPFENLRSDLTSPGRHAFAVTPDDNTDLTTTPRALYVGSGGNLAITTIGGDTVTLENVPDAFFVPVRVARVLATGTTAGGLIGLY
ncbi:hypothetical protein RGUI_0185 [Rhodovulum sp. P5]|uniref:spike base protein, RCAP_Rcc01079 family n=1 Tax=Rhodovulum sp. P5 TaxID=1564506 RepID=UPI0009C22E85|nr:hypothetical protein [Rhodovulum sp. P5]ARE38326.1 hypothetical protein RGUI_0185 [Rhodovulum sp. P5]